MSEIIETFVGGAAGASVIGASHVARNKPNQDSVGWEQSRLWTYIAVADGHGSSPHYRSDRGSRMAVETLFALFRAITLDGALREPGPLASRIPGLAATLVRQWQAKVDADIAGDRCLRRQAIPATRSMARPASERRSAPA